MDWNNEQSRNQTTEQQPYDSQDYVPPQPPYGSQDYVPSQPPYGSQNYAPPQPPYGSQDYVPPQPPYGSQSFVPPRPPANGLAVASLVMGILAVMTICTVYGAFIFGGLAIIFALLSKGYEKNMHSLAVSGTVIGSIALVITVVVFAFSIFLLMSDKAFQQQFNSIYENMYGESPDEQLNDIFGL